MIFKTCCRAVPPIPHLYLVPTAYDRSGHIVVLSVSIINTTYLV